MYVLTDLLRRRLIAMCKLCRNMGLARQLGGLKISDRCRDELMSMLNESYWQRADFTSRQKDESRDLYSELQGLKMAPKPAPTPQSAPRPSRPSMDEMRGKLLDIKRRQQQRRQGSPEVSDMDLKKELITLGHDTPELRDHLRPILATLDKSSAKEDLPPRQVEAAMASSSLDAAVKSYLDEIIKMMNDMIRKTPRVKLRVSRLAAEGDHYVFTVIKDRSNILGDVYLKYDGKMLHAHSPLMGERGSFNVKLMTTQPAKALCKELMLEITDLIL